MEKEKIEIIYNMLIEGSKLTDESLLENGFSLDDKDLLIKKRVLEFDKKTKMYKLVLVDKFRRYGIKLLFLQKAREANICFRICYELCPNGKHICLQYLLALLNRKYPDYEKVFEVFATLEKIRPDKYVLNYNLYLYLLNIITDCPTEYVDRVKNMTEDDLGTSKFIHNKSENDVRDAIFKGKFTYALGLVNETISKMKKDYSVKWELIKFLLIKVVESEQKFKKDLMVWANTQQYAKIVFELEEKKKKRRLGQFDEYTLLVANAIVNLLRTKIVTVPTVCVTDNMQEALAGKNFVLALSLNEQFIERTGDKKEDNVLNKLLVDLNKMISTLSESRNDGLKVSFSERTTLAELLDIFATLGCSKYGIAPELFKQFISDAEDFAYGIASEKLNFEEVKKKFGIKLETSLLIKLIYARDCYIEASINENNEEQYVKCLEGDSWLRQVEDDGNKSALVLCFLEIVKYYREKACEYNHGLNDTVNKRSLVPKKSVV